jgi:hypothetical protein
MHPLHLVWAILQGLTCIPGPMACPSGQDSTPPGYYEPIHDTLYAETTFAEYDSDVVR